MLDGEEEYKGRSQGLTASAPVPGGRDEALLGGGVRSRRQPHLLQDQHGHVARRRQENLRRSARQGPREHEPVDGGQVTRESAADPSCDLYMKSVDQRKGPGARHPC